MPNSFFWHVEMWKALIRFSSKAFSVLHAQSEQAASLSLQNVESEHDEQQFCLWSAYLIARGWALWDEMCSLLCDYNSATSVCHKMINSVQYNLFSSYGQNDKWINVWFSAIKSTWKPSAVYLIITLHHFQYWSLNLSITFMLWFQHASTTRDTWQISAAQKTFICQTLHHS